MQCIDYNYFPAPGTYDPDKSDEILNKSSAYSFGLKTQGPRPDNVPGEWELYFKKNSYC